MRRNCEKRSGIALRFGGTITWATCLDGDSDTSLPLIVLPFRPSISHGSGCASRTARG
jgi:hypothetical protein